MNQEKKQSVFDYLNSIRNRDVFQDTDTSDSINEDCVSENEAHLGKNNPGKINTNNDDDYFKSSSYDYFRNFNGSNKFSFNEKENEENKGKNDIGSKKDLRDKKVVYKTKNVYSGEDFEHLDVLGSGAYAEVVKVRHKKTLEIFAMKIIDKCLLDKEERLFQIYVENEFLNILNHPNIIKIYGTFEENEKMHLVLEYVPNGTLASLIKKASPMPKNLMVFFVAQIVGIIEYLASKNIVHRDLKPENFVVDNKFNLKLIDFATACYPDCYFDEDTYKYLNEEEFNMLPETKKFNFLKNQSSQGTPNYMPPEIINNSLKCGIYSDLWSLGCIIYDMIYNKPPFLDKTEYLVFENIINLKYSFPPDKQISDDVKDLIEKLLQLNPQERMSYTGDLSELKNHKFFNSFDPETLQSDLRETFKNSAKPKKYSTANQILTSNFHRNSIVNKQSKVISSCKIDKKYQNSDINYWDDPCNDEDETNFNSSNNNSNINSHHVNAILNNLNNNNNGNNNNFNSNVNSNIGKGNCIIEGSSNQNYFSCLKVKNKKNSKPLKNYKTEKKAQKDSNIAALVDYSNSDFDEEDHLEDISKEELDEQKEVFVPSHHFDVRIPKNNSVKNFGFRFNYTTLGFDLPKIDKIIKSEDDFSLRSGSFGRATVPDKYVCNNNKSKFFLETNGANKSSDLDNLSLFSGFSEKIKIIESKEETILKQGILKIFIKESGKYELIKLVLYANCRLEVIELLSDLKLKSLLLDKGNKFIAEKNHFELVCREEEIKIHHEDEKEIRSWVNFIKSFIAN